MANYSSEIDRQLIDVSSAMTRGNAPLYAQLCDKYGITPEREDLYELGKADLVARANPSFLESKVSVAKPSNAGKRPNYAGFLRDAVGCGVSILPNQDIGVKRHLLTAYFEKFSPIGRQDLRKYGDADVGKIFSKVIIQAKRDSRKK